MPVEDRKELTDLLLYVAILSNVSPDFYKKISTALSNLTHACRNQMSNEFPEYINMVNIHSELRNQKREIVLRLALDKELTGVLFLLVEKDPYFELEHEDLK